MKRRMCYLLMATLLVTSWVSVITINKPLSPYASANPQVDRTPEAQHVPEQQLEPAFDSAQKNEGKANGYDERETWRGLSRLGSIPPRCEHKCRGCAPCEPIQIPTTAGKVGIQYANYEPEGWRCKCGSSYFIP